MSRFLIVWLVISIAAPCAAAEPMRLVVKGQERSVLMVRPEGQVPRPTIIVLHGGGGEAAREAQHSGLDRLGPQEGFAVVFPQAVAGLWNFFPPGKETPQFVRAVQHLGGVPDDVAFFGALVAALVRDGIADPKRIYLAGRSLGGVMALRLVCVDAESFAAIALLVSTMPEAIGAGCEPVKPVPALMINGTRDRVLPYKGERTAAGDILWSTQRLIGFFRRLNDCAGPAREAALDGYDPHSVVVESAMACTGGPVISYRIVGGGHEVPPGLNAARKLVDFFRDKTR